MLELLGGSKAAGGVDPASLQHYLTLQYVPEPATLHRGIRRIESGTSFTRGRRRAAHEALLPPDVHAPAGCRRTSEQELYDRIAGGARRVGAPSTCGPTSRSGSFLSSGIDSTAIAALAKRYNPSC